MTIKRAVALAAALTLSVGLSACGDEEETPNPTEVATTETSAESATGDESTDEERLDGPTDAETADSDDDSTSIIEQGAETEQAGNDEDLDAPDGKPSKLEINEALWESFQQTGFTADLNDTQLEQVRADFHVLFECVLDEGYDDLSVEGAQKLAEGTSSSPTELSDADDDVMGEATDKCIEEMGMGSLADLGQPDVGVSDGR